ncbi:hypothetical protein CYMTET_42499 [Cymbomonas tetramitiformis]|uniref:Uncharacterized protein n=1 Tax=Cymbomonas tetramitiformis TaxID=36881 RepID=A0AAE0C653_9CHLO|nr:hypothetical protein CYMTET_42499 [Cymbomonas tetramitiformis]
MRALVASLGSGLEFGLRVAASLSTTYELMASNTASDVIEAIQLIVLAHQFDVDNSAAAVRRALSLVFSREPAVGEAVLEGAQTLYLRPGDTPMDSAMRLAGAARGAALGTLTALEDIIAKLVSAQPPVPISPSFGLNPRFVATASVQVRLLPATGQVVRALWTLVADRSATLEAVESKRAALAVLGMAAAAQPEVVRPYLSTLLQVGFSEGPSGDALLTRYACIAIQRLALPGGRRAGVELLPSDHAVFAAIRKLLVNSSLADQGWYSAAEQAVTAVFMVCTDPEAFSAGVLRDMAGAGALPPSGGGGAEEPAVGVAIHSGEVSESRLARFLYVLGHSALKQLVYTEGLIKVRGRARG